MRSLRHRCNRWFGLAVMRRWTRVGLGQSASSPRHAEQGYTLLEILVVLTIIALLAAVVGPRVLGYLGKAKSETAKVQIKEISSALELYFLDNGSYPPQQAGLKALVSAPAEAKKWAGPYLKAAEGLTDPWGQAYLYKVPGARADYDVSSLGRDNAPGGEGEDKDLGGR
jgi:general secretion pathway protein G